MKQRAAAWILAISLAAGALVAAEHALFLSTPDLLPFSRPDEPSAETIVVEAQAGSEREPASGDSRDQAPPAPNGDTEGGLTIADVVPTAAPAPGPSFQPPSLGGAGYVRDGRIDLALDSLGLQGLDAVIQRQLAVLSGNSCGPFGPWVETTSSAQLPPGSCALYRVLVGGDVVFTHAEPVKFDGSQPLIGEVTVVEEGNREHVVGSTLYVAAGAESLRPVSVSAGASDPESGLASALFTNGRASVEVKAEPWAAQLAPSPGTIGIAITNNAGDTASASLAVVADGTAPEGVSISYPAAAAAGEIVPIATATGTDSGSGVNPASIAVERRVSTLTEAGCEPFGEWVPTGAADVAREGTCAQYRIRVSDNVGNESVVRSDVILRVADLTGPSSTITSPAAESELTGEVVVTASAEDEGSGVRSVAIQVAEGGSGAWSTLETRTSRPYAAVWDTLAVEPGAYDLRAVAVDRAGNTSVSAVVSVTVAADEAAPTTSITSPAAGTSVSGVVAVAAVAEDESSGVASVTIQVSTGGCWRNLGSLDGASGAVDWDTSGLRPGTYFLRSVAVDRRGNVGKSRPIRVVIEEPEPAEAPEPAEESVDPAEPSVEPQPAEEPQAEPDAAAGEESDSADAESEPEPEAPSDPEPEPDSASEGDAGEDDEEVDSEDAD